MTTSIQRKLGLLPDPPLQSPGGVNALHTHVDPSRTPSSARAAFPTHRGEE